MSIATDAPPSPANIPGDAPPRHHRWRVVAVICVAAVIGGLAWRSHHVRYKNFSVYDDGKVLRGAWLEPHVMAQLVEQHQVRTVVNLCDITEKQTGRRIHEERKAVEGAGARLIELPFPANTTSNTDDPVFRQFETLLDDRSAYPIWVHCWHGRERTAKALAIYDIRRRHMTADESLRTANLWGDEHPQAIVDFARRYESDQPSD